MKSNDEIANEVIEYRLVTDCIEEEMINKALQIQKEDILNEINEYCDCGFYKNGCVGCMMKALKQKLEEKDGK